MGAAWKKYFWVPVVVVLILGIALNRPTTLSPQKPAKETSQATPPAIEPELVKSSCLASRKAVNQIIRLGNLFLKNPSRYKFYSSKINSQVSIIDRSAEKIESGDVYWSMVAVANSFGMYSQSLGLNDLEGAITFLEQANSDVGSMIGKCAPYL